MVIFALFSYELGNKVKASIFSLKGMLAFLLLSHTEGEFLCGIVEDYRTFAEDFKRVLEFVEWLEEEGL